ncbi:2-isopropylmalate synthase [Oceanospirillum beijerinckii]|uniref:2-isopropylmalate synthase n=1 Tax=Oceanospirillum beijerinckii TaxID=64976 RepID=UPI0003FB6C01|nr:2-isopropylmalate synthase [Oceanospirillum beijerinckii]MAC47863.1 2-isopropylmalate synthase [Oceanospirillum sp.]
MNRFDHKKYVPFPAVQIENRQWPDQVIDKAPTWCSVDLRDGNQALIDPMTVEQKKRLFSLLVKLGFKEIEVGFPAASQPDFDFVRALIDENMIPDDVTVQVLTQAREHLIDRTIEALKGVKKAIVHVYNSTSTVQREQVFRMERSQIVDIAVSGVRMVKERVCHHTDTEWRLEYSPESFTGTELDFAVEICDAVVAEWGPSQDNKIILNLPATVEMSTPNVFADQIEWFCRNIKHRDCVEISLHTHNDRGCAVAAAELGVMAGADRVEGTLMGNGERTGNMDIITMAMNLYSQGVDPELDLSGAEEIVEVVEACTNIPVNPRHPYIGELVYTAFSGSHQDAIKKCLSTYDEGSAWNIAYLPIDPRDLGRSYEAVIRINSQSGKGGVAYILESEYGLQLPRWMQVEFARKVQARTEAEARELKQAEIWDTFNQAYLQNPVNAELVSYKLERSDKDYLEAVVRQSGEESALKGEGNGAIHALTQALQVELGEIIEVTEYSEHALSSGSDAKAVTYVQVKIGEETVYGVAVSEDTVAANLNAVLAAVSPVLAVKEVAAA